MTRSFGAHRLQVGVDTWAQEASDPNLGGGVAAAIGSFWIESGTLPTVPVEMYLNENGTATGWARENLVNINVFNVKNPPFNAVGDGVADDTVAINAAITAANAAGGGTVYFPAPGIYRCTKPPGLRQSFYLSNVHDILFLGDGPNSLISMIGSAGGGDWYMFRLGNGTSRIGFYNLGLLGSGITNPDPADQHHFIQNEGLIGDAIAAGARHIDIVGNYFGQIVGDGIRNIAESGHEVSDIRVLLNTFDMVASRSCIEAQRYSRRIQFCWNWCTGSTDQLVDFEPTGGSGLGTAGPEEWQIIGNHMDGTGGSITVTQSGAGTADPTAHTILAFNTIAGGDGVEGLSMTFYQCVGNIVISNNATSNSVYGFIRSQSDFVCVGNIGISLDPNASKIVFSFDENLVSDPFQVTVSENIARTKTNSAAGTYAISMVGGAQFIVSGNIAVVDSTVATVSKAIGMSSTALPSVLDHAMAVGNLLVGTTTQLRTGINYHATNQPVRNILANYNFVDNGASGVLMDRAAAETFLDWRQANNNNCVGVTVGTIEVPATNVGSTIEGPAGPGPQATQVGVSAGPNGAVTAPSGSLNANTSGGNSTAVWYKETGTGVSGGNLGWLPLGGSEIMFAVDDTVAATTTALFLAPGMGLAAAIVTEIKVAVPRPGNVRFFRMRQIAGVGAGNTVYTLRINGVDKIAITALTTAVSGTFTASFVVAAGDLLSCKVTKSLAAGTAASKVTCSVDLA